MTSRLDEILENTRATLPRLRRRLPDLRCAAERADPPVPWAGAFGGRHVAVIAEIKRRSPSAGAIAEDLEPAALGRAYRDGGAAAVSVLTDERFFGGSLRDLTAVRDAVDLPVLRKDFVLDPVQVYEARAAGASAVLLIVRALEISQLADLAGLARELGMGALVEVHDRVELDRALTVDGVTIGVNSRDLSTFSVDLRSIETVLRHVPRDHLAVAESGLAGRSDVALVARWGADAVLIGSALAGAADPVAAIARLVKVERHGRD